MRAVNFQGPSGPNDFQRWATESFREIERASRDGVQTAKGFYVKLATDQNVTAGVFTKLVNFSPVEFDTSGHFSLSAQRWTPRAGLVLLYLQVFTTPAGIGGQIVAVIYKNGVLAAAGNAVIESASDAANGLIGRADYSDNANGTDYYEAVFFTTGTEVPPKALASGTRFYGIEL